MKIPRFASITAILLLWATIPCFAADGNAPDATPADTSATAPTDNPGQAQTSPNNPPPQGGIGRGQISTGNVYFQSIEENDPNTNNATYGGDTFGMRYEQGMTLTQLINTQRFTRADAITKVWLGHRDTPRRGTGAGFATPTMTLVDYAAIKSGQAQDIPLSPNDEVKVQVSFVNFAVKSDQATALNREKIAYKEGMTVMQLIKTEGAGIKWMDLGNVTMGHIYGPRGLGIHDTVVKVDYAAIASGQAKDIPLAAGYWVQVGIKPFVFDGGTPRQVIKAVEDFFGVDLSMANIPPEMADAQVPKFRISAPIAANDVMQIYNQLGAKIPALGQWLWENHGGGLDPTYFDTPPDLLMLIPDKSVAQANADKKVVKARAISIAAIPAAKWNELQSDILKADAVSQQYIRETGGAAVSRGGTVQLQDDSKILIAIGIPSFIELAESVVAAYEANFPAQRPAAVNLLPAGEINPATTMHGNGQNIAHYPGFLAMPLPDDAAQVRFQPTVLAGAGTSPAVNLTALTQPIGRGDAVAFALFYDRYGFRIYKHLLVLAKGDEQAAREVFQTVAIKLAKKIAVFDDEGTLWAWLRRVAFNAFIDYCRARQREARFVPMEEMELVLPGAAAGENKLREALRLVLADCAPADRELLSAVYVDGCALGELAAQTGQSYKALESHLSRLRQKLRQKLLSHLRHEA